MHSFVIRWNKAKTAISILALLFIFSCKKYPDGPSFTIIPKKDRLCRPWKLSETLLNDTNFTYTQKPDSDVIEYQKNYKYLVTFNSHHPPITKEGKWEFHEKKEQIITTGTGVADTLTITKLSTKELWLSKQTAQGKIKLKYKSNK